MITEDYVSFKTAILLKKKGFDGGCHFIGNENGGGLLPVSWPTTNSDIVSAGEPMVAVPTLQMAMKWLREVHELQCQIDCPLIIFNWRYGIRDLDKDEWVTPRNIGDYDTYEEACEAAIKYCLENLV